MKTEKGMANYYDQARDRWQWKKAITKRNRIIKEILALTKSPPEKMHEMKIKDLKALKKQLKEKNRLLKAVNVNKNHPTEEIRISDCFPFNL